MKQTFLFFLLTICLVSFAQKPYAKEGQIYLPKNGSNYQVTHDEYPIENSSPTISPDKGKICFIRTYLIDTEGEKENMDIARTDLVMFDIATEKEIVLVEGCDGISGGTKIDYANSQFYNFSCIFNIKSLSFSENSQKIVFVSGAWQTSDAVHACDVNSRQIYFLTSGEFKGFQQRGHVIVNKTGVDTKTNKGRWWRDAEYDEDGEFVKWLSEESY